MLLLSIIGYGRDMQGMYFFIFASCEPLMAKMKYVIYQIDPNTTWYV